MPRYRSSYRTCLRFNGGREQQLAASLAPDNTYAIRPRAPGSSGAPGGGSPQRSPPAGHTPSVPAGHAPESQNLKKKRKTHRGRAVRHLRHLRAAGCCGKMPVTSEMKEAARWCPPGPTAHARGENEPGRKKRGVFTKRREKSTWTKTLVNKNIFYLINASSTSFTVCDLHSKCLLNIVYSYISVAF